jgi:glycosyltransferase involved in cell wall biosynthesis
VNRLRQTWVDLEVIVVEGGSTEQGTLDEVRRLEAAGLPRVRLLYRDGPKLVGDNRNYGIQHARGRYVCCLDADDRLDPIYIEVAVFLAECGGFDVVYPSVRCFAIRDCGEPSRLKYQDNGVSTVAWPAEHLARSAVFATGAGPQYAGRLGVLAHLGHGRAAIRKPLMDIASTAESLREREAQHRVPDQQVSRPTGIC